jgi:Rieske Fe-S protein
MSNHELAAGERRAVEALTSPAIRALRRCQSEGISRRRLLRQSLGIGVGLWLAEVGAGTLSFLWSASTAGNAAVRAGSFDEIAAMNSGLPIGEGFPAYVPAARAFVVLLDPSQRRFLPGVDPTGDGTALNVRALSQVCPHLGCRPNPCIEDFWFRCPCHQSRYDRLGTKATGEQFGPAPRSMDRLAIAVDRNGVLTIETGRITLGPLPVALGRPGIIPPLVPNGCT